MRREPQIRERLVVLALALGVGGGALGGCAPAPAPVAATPEPSRAPSRISPQLWSLHEAYEAARARGGSVPPGDALARIVDDRVVIEATAAGEVATLQADLLALGMQRPAAFGRRVSGELPIAAIPSLAALDSLRFAAPASAALRDDPGRSPGSRSGY
jgi:hypothetical protein